MKSQLNHKRNELFEGVEIINPPCELKLGTYVPQIFDAKILKHGVTWYRVKGGFTNKGDREDWIADLPEVSVSVHDYHWNGEDFGPDYETFDNACWQELIEGHRNLLHKKEKLLTSLVKVCNSLNFVIQIGIPSE